MTEEWEPKRIGRPPGVARGTIKRIYRHRVKGETWAQIAHRLNQTKVPTSQGGPAWLPSTVRQVMNTAWAREVMEDMREQAADEGREWIPLLPEKA